MNKHAGVGAMRDRTPPLICTISWQNKIVSMFRRHKTLRGPPYHTNEDVASSLEYRLRVEDSAVERMPSCEDGGR